MHHRHATPRHYAMCPPLHFEVSYSINPWMDPSVPVDRRRALAQWEALRATYQRLGHTVEIVPPVAGLPDMVFAANGALVHRGRALGVRFANPQRAAEAEAYLAWLHTHGHPEAQVPTHVNEGEGDFLVAGGVILAGTGFRTHPLAHAEVAAWFDCEVLTLHLVDPRYYHLDTALCVLDDATVAYLPAAFSAASRALLEARFPGAVQVSEADAEVLGLNAVSDGRHVVLNAEAEGFAAQLEAVGFVPVPVDLSELRKSGGGPKCCTMELRYRAVPEAAAATA
jgi:N-dimethylarginine dimethylaminohydrolase